MENIKERSSAKDRQWGGDSDKGFISIDCGSDEDYIDEETGIPHKTDKDLIDTGIVKTVSPDSPEDLPQARFVYGNYDGENQTPIFDLHLGVNEWKTVNLTNSGAYGYYYDIIHVPLTDCIDVCLINTGRGVPFISALELRPLDISIYQAQGGALLKVWGYDVGSNSSENAFR
ncbi:hypothetical protein SO802_005361 [Lithocarpus litseifolius]|uniref:Malectin-like domain-containing protein n=1 Tax=Lithocarpus litseifolius TaxID=425828 RepID=A0AAW2DL06_9ROSI